MRPSCAALSFSSSHAQHAELVTPYSRYNLWTEQGFAKSKQPRPGAGASPLGLSGASVVRIVNAPQMSQRWPLVRFDVTWPQTASPLDPSVRTISPRTQDREPPTRGGS